MKLYCTRSTAQFVQRAQTRQPQGNESNRIKELFASCVQQQLGEVRRVQQAPIFGQLNTQQGSSHKLPRGKSIPAIPSQRSKLAFNNAQTLSQVR